MAHVLVVTQQGNESQNVDWTACDRKSNSVGRLCLPRSCNPREAPAALQAPFEPARVQSSNTTLTFKLPSKLTHGEAHLSRCLLRREPEFQVRVFEQLLHRDTFDLPLSVLRTSVN